MVSLWILVGSAVAQLTPADTEITNQASATFNDSAGLERTTTSNQVVTIVQQVYDFSITPDATYEVDGGGQPTAVVDTVGQTRTGLAGATVYLNYLVTNTGNGQDTVTLTTSQDLTGTELVGDLTLGATATYLDANCNGNVDTGEVAADAVTLEANASACVVLAGSVPSTGATEGHIDLIGTSVGGGSDEGNWATVARVTTAALDARLSAQPTDTITNGGTITYTYTGSNTGVAAYGVPVDATTLGAMDTDAVVTANEGIIVVTDVPDNATYQLGTLRGDAGGGTGDVIEIYYDGAAWSVTEPETATDVQKVGMIIDAGADGTVAFFPQGASYSMTFGVTAGALSAGAEIVNQGSTVTFGTSGGDTTGTTVNSNWVRHTMAAGHGVAVGPGGDPTAAGGDTQTIPLAHTGETVVFDHTLRNTGNSADAFTLAIASAGPAADDGWTCSLRHSNGTSPLTSEIGPIDAGADFDFAIACAIPQANANATDPEVDADIVVTVSAASVGDPSQTDDTTDTVTDVDPGYAVELFTALAANTPFVATDYVEETVESRTLVPGQSFSVPLLVRNASQHAEVYDLSSSIGGGASAWNTEIFADANCDGTADGAMTTKTDVMDAGAEACFVATGRVPAETAPGTPAVAFTATSTVDPDDVNDSVNGTFTVATVSSIVLEPDRAGTVTNPGTITYTLSVRNRGNATADVQIADPESNFTGWVYQLSSDGTSWDSTLDIDDLGVGASATIHVRVLVPAGQPIGRVDTRALTAAADFDGDGNADGSDSATLSTTVVGGDLVLEKSAETWTCVDAGDTGSDVTVADPDDAGSECTVAAYGTAGDEAKPGDYIAYTVVATNIGTAGIDNIVIVEPIPNFTEFVDVAGEASLGVAGTDYDVLFSQSSTGGWTTEPGWDDTSFTTGQALYVGLSTLDGGTLDAVVDSNDVLPPAQTVTLTLVVKVK